MSGEIKVGQAVWVRNVLEKGKLIERKIFETETRNGIVLINLSKFHTMPDVHTIDGLVFKREQAIMICHQALREKSQGAQKELSAFISEHMVSKAGRPYSAAW